MGLIRIPSNNETFRRPVTVTFPAPAGQEPATAEFEVEYNRIDQPEIESWVEEGWYVTRIVDRMVRGVYGVDDGTGKEADPQTAKEMVLRSPECCTAVRNTFFDALGQTPPQKTSKKQRWRG